MDKNYIIKKYLIHILWKLSLQQTSVYTELVTHSSGLTKFQSSLLITRFMPGQFNHRGLYLEVCLQLLDIVDCTNWAGN